MVAGRRLSRAALIGVAAVVVGLVCWAIVFAADEVRVATVASDAVQGVAAVFAGVMCLRVGARSDRHGWVRGWRLIGTGMLAWAAGELAWTYDEVIRNVPAPQLSAADVGFLAMVPLVLWGLSNLIGLYRGAAMGVIEGLTIALSLLYVSWATVLGPVYAMRGTGEISDLLWTVNIGYPLGDVAIAAAALILLGSVQRGQRMSVALLAVGMLALAIADSTYVAIATTYQTGDPIDVAWITGLLLIGVAGLVAAAAPPAPELDHETPRIWITLPYIPLSLAALTSIVLAALGRAPSLVLSVLLVALFGLVVLRQVLALRERHTLAANLQSTLRQVRQQQEILNQLVFTDRLTGLANRAMFEERITPVEQLQQTTTTVMFVDLDRFKEINDIHGHEIGDAVLVAAALRLRTCCRAEDTVARVGGDEFVVLAQGVSPNAVEQVAQRFVNAMRQPVNVHGLEIGISASIGIATGDPRDTDVHELIRRADAAMYIAKVAGPGRYATYPRAAGAPARA